MNSAFHILLFLALLALPLGYAVVAAGVSLDVFDRHWGVSAIVVAFLVMTLALLVLHLPEPLVPDPSSLDDEMEIAPPWPGAC